jgi:hypothetical protein
VLGTSLGGCLGPSQMDPPIIDHPIRHLRQRSAHAYVSTTNHHVIPTLLPCLVPSVRSGGHHPQLPQHHHHSSVHTKHITNPDRGLEELRADEIAADVRATFVRDQSKCPNYNKWPKSSDGDFSVEKIRDQVIERLYEPGRIFQVTKGPRNEFNLLVS